MLHITLAIEQGRTHYQSWQMQCMSDQYFTSNCPASKAMYVTGEMCAHKQVQQVWELYDVLYSYKSFASLFFWAIPKEPAVLSR